MVNCRLRRLYEREQDLHVLNIIRYSELSIAVVESRLITLKQKCLLETIVYKYIYIFFHKL